MISLRKYAVLAVTCLLLGASLAYVSATRLQSSSHGIGVLKSADSFAYVGDVIEYKIKVYNPSDYALNGINVTDAMLGFNDTIPFMDANNMTGKTYTFHREVLETDPNPLINEVSVESFDSTGAYLSGSTQAVTAIAERHILINKFGPESAYSGEVIDYTIAVNNTWEDTLLNVIVEDEMLGFSWQGDLNKGETNTFNLSYTVPCDVKGNLTNVATVWAQANETTFYAESAWTTKIAHPYPFPRSKGYWKNHPDKWPVDSVKIGDTNYTKEEAIGILTAANAKDATRMLAAQLIAAKLNRFSGATPDFLCHNKSFNIDEVIEDADEFLIKHPIGSDPRDENRQNALQIKDILDSYNNSHCS